MMKHTNVQNTFLDSLSSEAFFLLYLVVHTKSDRGSCMKTEKEPVYFPTSTHVADCCLKCREVVR